MKLVSINKCFFLLLIIFASQTYALDSIQLTVQEKQFLQAHPTITLGTDSGWAPHVIHNENGKISGYDADVLALINQVSGANFVLKLGNWKEITTEQKNRNIDGLSTAVANQDRALHSNFSDSYVTLDKIIFTRKDLSYNIETLADLNGRKFGVLNGDAVSKAFTGLIKDIEVITFDTPRLLIEGVTTGKADFLLGNGTLFYLLNKTGNPFLRPAIFIHDDPLKLVFVIRNDFPEAISIINKSLKIIGKEKLLQLKKKWLSAPSQKNAPTTASTFSEQELTYLNKKKQLKLCIDPNWMPLEKIENGQHIGMSAEYFEFFQRNIHIPITLVETQTWNQSLQLTKNRGCDLISLAMPTPDRNKYLNFSDSLLETPVVLATKPHITFISDLSHIKNKKIGIIKGYAFNEIIRREYPNIEVVDVNNAQQGLQKVVNDELFGYIDALATIGYMFQTKFVGELKISGKFDNKWEMSVATRNDEPLLLNIMNKLIRKIPHEKHQQIFNNYVAINYKQGFDYRLFGQIMLTLFILLLLFFSRYHTISTYNRRTRRYLDVINDNVLISTADPFGNITDASHALCQLTGYTKEELIGKNHNIFRHPKTPKSVYKSQWEKIRKGNVWQGELLNLNKDGSCYWSSVKITPFYYRNGKFRGYTAIRQDISDKKRLEKLAITDVLTQIPNRLFINRCFNDEFERSKRHGNHFSIILIDIDLFKQINDSYGHQVGDDVLINLATILKQNIRQLDQLGRWGGEEFLVICPETNLYQAELVAQKLKDIIEEFEFAGTPSITCSFGIAMSRSDDSEEAIFQRADNALYAAKHAGRNQVKREE